MVFKNHHLIFKISKIHLQQLNTSPIAVFFPTSLASIDAKIRGEIITDLFTHFHSFGLITDILRGCELNCEFLLLHKEFNCT